jgi:cell fate regulator YaaT (PSP1 superfamily)
MSNNEGYFVEVSYDSSKGKRHYYTLDNSLKINDYVVIETPLGTELGTISGDLIKESNSSYSDNTLAIIRKATNEDITAYENNKKDTQPACEIFNNGITKLKLDMKLVSAMYTLDKTKILFCYVSEERVDFRELLKELSSNLKCRIELKQIGARDRSKNIGGIGICGLPLCCSSFLNEFEGISINMAKNQYLALNTQKLSGQCNKLLCCLKYEDSDYTKLKEGVPKIGQKFNYEGKHCKIASINLLSQVARIESDDKELILNVTIEELKKIVRNGSK